VIILFLLLVALITFNAWPDSLSLPGGGDTVENAAAKRPAGPSGPAHRRATNSVTYQGGGASATGSAKGGGDLNSQDPGGSPSSPTSPGSSQSGTGGDGGTAPSVEPTVQDTTGQVQGTVNDTTGSLNGTVSGTVNGVQNTVNGTLNGLP
jgi:hypothetical protein